MVRSSFCVHLLHYNEIKQLQHLLLLTVSTHGHCMFTNFILMFSLFFKKKRRKLLLFLSPLLLIVFPHGMFPTIVARTMLFLKLRSIRQFFSFQSVTRYIYLYIYITQWCAALADKKEVTELKVNMSGTYMLLE